MEANLALAEAAMQQAQEVKPEANELEAIRQFCAIEIRKREESEALQADVRQIRSDIKNLKDLLAEDLKSLGSACAAISKSDAVRLEAMAAAAGIPGMPPYLRKLQANKDSNITPDVVREAFDSITAEALKEAAQTSPGKDPKDLLREVFLKNVRLLIRGYTESLRLCPSMQRGSSMYEIPEVKSSTADTMFRLWTLEQSLKSKLASKQKDPDVDKEQQRLKERVEAFFVRTSLTAQRLVVEGKPYRLVRRISITKAKIGIGRLEKLLDSALKTQNLDLSTFRPSEWARSVQMQMASVAPESKTHVKLCSVKVAKDD